MSHFTQLTDTRYTKVSTSDDDNTIVGESDYHSESEDMEKNNLTPLKKVMFPIRYLMSIMVFFGFWNVYGMRVNLSIAIVKMVSKTNITVDGEEKTVQEFDWDSGKQGILLSSFFWGYIFTQIPGGLLAQKFGGKKVYGLGIFFTSVLTALTPLVAHHGGYKWFLFLRIIEGLGEGVTFPAQHSFWSKWAPKLERTRLVSMGFSGSYAGTVVALPLCGVLADYYGWESIFYVYGAIGLLWTILWMFLASETPEDHRFISQNEITYIQNTRGSETENISIRDIPWKALLCSAPLYAVIAAHFAENWGFYTLLTELPTYMKTVLKFDLKKSGFLGAVPYLVLTILVLAAGQLADFLRKRKILSTTAVRKIFSTIGNVCQAVFLLLTGWTTNSIHAVIFLTLAVGLGGFSISAFSVNHLDIGPRYAGLLMGITNTIATIPGIISPTITGFITHNHTLVEWRTVFFISSGIYVLGAIIFGIFASGETQYWNDSKIRL